MTTADTKKLYRIRFAEDQGGRDALWSTLCRDFFQRYDGPDDTVLDVAAGWCEFINNIEAATRIAVDLNPDVKLRAAPGVVAHVGPSTAMTEVADASVDVAFVSNLFEHLTRPEIVTTLEEIRRVLRRGGRLLILQPNVRYCAKDYWQFFDHITPIDDRALVEVLELTDFTIAECRPRFLPYTTASRLPTWPALVSLYLRVPPAHRVLGKQAFVVARSAS
jgi:SAM-dependent methyltransferase